MTTKAREIDLDALVLSAGGHEPDGEMCLITPGALDRKGYGRVSVNGRTRRAHVVAWEAA